MPLITSLLDTDLYKFTMQQAVWARFPHTSVEYVFRCRSADIDLRPFADEIRAEIDALGALRLTDDELAFLRSIRYIKAEFVDALQRFRLDPSAVTITTDGGFALRIAGSWFQTILYEVPVLAIVNAVFFRHTHPLTDALRAEGEHRLAAKCAAIDASPTPLRIMEFGTRRRYSGSWQRHVATHLKERIGESLLGTSNVLLAKDLALRPFGTMAHEFLQAGQAFTHVLDSQRLMLETWMQEYRGDLGIALSDIFGNEAFFRDFDLLFAKAYDGARHDSGDPFVWCERLLAHYDRLGIDSRTKTAVFSDGLDIDKAVALSQAFDHRIRTIFGIGTHLTNDLGVPALQIVIKMTRCNGRPVLKVSESPGKALAEDPTYLAYVRDALGPS
jgi:nicotinate phosphoribosyltransferase